MTQRSQFVISNEDAKPLTLVLEPEASEFRLSKNEDVVVTDEFTNAPVTLRLSVSERGELFVSIWPGDGDVKVEKEGVDILDLIQKAPNARSA